MINPKYFMLNCKFIALAAPNMTYEDYLIEVINYSRFFRSKCNHLEQYVLVEDESHGEDDVKCSQYSLDFKLLVNQDIMRVMNKNKPEIDYTKKRDGFIFIKTKEDPLPMPQNTLLLDLMNLKFTDIKQGRATKTIENILKNLGKNKNLLFYYPYEFSSENNINPIVFENLLTKSFSIIMSYRLDKQNKCDTFICIKSNFDFLIYEWENNKFNFRDKVNDLLCSNYRNTKLYSLY